MAKVLLEVKQLAKHFVIGQNSFSNKQIIHALKGINFQLHENEVLGLIGESGSGKSTVANIVLKLLNPSMGTVYLFDKEITHLSEKDMRKHRKDLQIIFQYTHNVLDPKMTIEELLIEPLKIHKIVPNEQLTSEVDRLLGLVGLAKSEKLKLPSEISGGQVQRVIIARAIATRPRIIVCDEPVSALDVSVQGQILNLLARLKNDMNLTYLFISHDLKVIKHICDRIAVMYQGEIVEIGQTEQILHNPKEEYTKMLVESKL
jgi:peptide/nickel transport system ATP-binding protein/oligopeptide transport system ATP-binding protein